jgi:hypothetical protein
MEKEIKKKLKPFQIERVDVKDLQENMNLHEANILNLLEDC